MVIDMIISGKIKNILPDIQLGCINAEVNVQPSARELLNYMDQIVKNVKVDLNIDQVSRVKVIAETKDAYRKLGKDPSRYRPDRCFHKSALGWWHP